MITRLIDFFPADPKYDFLMRLSAASVGGYALCWSLFVLLCAYLPYEKATLWYLTGQIAPLPFLFALLWAFVAQSPLRALAWPFGLALLFAFAGWLR